MSIQGNELQRNGSCCTWFRVRVAPMTTMFRYRNLVRSHSKRNLSNHCWILIVQHHDHFQVRAWQMLLQVAVQHQFESQRQNDSHGDHARSWLSTRLLSMHPYCGNFMADEDPVKDAGDSVSCRFCHKSYGCLVFNDCHL